MSDQSKPPVWLVPLAGLGRIARVMEAGNRDGRQPGDWQRMTPDDFRNAMLRHVAGLQSGDGEDHLAAVAANALMLLWFEEQAVMEVSE